MKRVLSTQLPNPDRPVHLSEGEADHLLRVLRLRDGEVIEALDGRGRSALVTLRVKGSGPRIEFLEAPSLSTQNHANIPPVQLEMAILKGDAMEWVVEKAVELGVQTLIPTVTAHTVVQIKNKGPEAFRDRWQKIADQALKQCGRLDKLQVALPLTLEELLVQHEARETQPRLWFDEAGRDTLPYLADWVSGQPIQKLESVRLLIGPEGGWSHPERDLMEATLRISATYRLGLGPWVLRGETAALFASSLLTSAFRANLAGQKS